MRYDVLISQFTLQQRTFGIGIEHHTGSVQSGNGGRTAAFITVIAVFAVFAVVS